MTKTQKQSEKILDEILSLHPFLERKDIKEMPENRLQKLANKLQEPRLYNYIISRNIEEQTLKNIRRKFLQNQK